MAAKPGHGGAERRALEIVIPIRHVWWIGLLARHYAARKLHPLWILDANAHWLFRLWARLRLRRVVTVRASAPRAETMLGPAVSVLDCDWVVRMDGDELPSEALVAALHRLAAGELAEASGDIACLACARRWLRLEDGRVVFSRNRLFGREGEDHQYRVFRRAGLAFTEAIHTPGFEVDTRRLRFLGPETCIWHFNWICYSTAERRAKITAYDAQAPDAGSDFRAFYLPEEAPAGTHDWAPCPEPAVAAMCRRIARFRASPLCRLLLRIGPN
ncbi:hypothetical protein LNKW23_11590 [Paralimibaculum aggregatum]|uniref:Glycosyl transferase family 2 n=1 Tax=Paralimibaculum aggregatum TaxID=3036245 RepID=A0ABQ6LF40_9RHOB|nr:hypothetical protein [Limibaculum sp. NKW23]GMG81946.1 hypothetical protein LNKW23_11590 [Limibaculum sp. NKW23]